MPDDELTECLAGYIPPAVLDVAPPPPPPAPPPPAAPAPDVVPAAGAPLQIEIKWKIKY